MIVVTGASGLVGRLLIDELLSAGAPVRAVSRDPASVSLPAGVQVVPGDPRHPETLVPWLAGAAALFVHPITFGEHATDLVTTAREQGVQRLVALSAMNIDDPDEEQPSRMRGDRNREAEEAVIASGLPWTSLRASSFASNTARAFGPQVRAGDTVAYVYPGFEESLLDERDLAAVAAKALLTDELANRRLQVTGPQSLSHRETVEIIGTVLGRQLTFLEVPPAAARERMVGAGMPAAFVDALMSRYAKHSAKPQHPATDDVAQALGRPARTYGEWVSDHTAAFTG